MHLVQPPPNIKPSLSVSPIQLSYLSSLITFALSKEGSMVAQHIQVFAHQIDQFGGEHTDLRIIRKELCDLSAIPQQSTGASENAFVCFALFILGIMLILLSFTVHLC
jgi:hypothetical protein